MPGFETSHKVQRERKCSPKKGPAGHGRGQMPGGAARAPRNWMATGGPPGTAHLWDHPHCSGPWGHSERRRLSSQALPLFTLHLFQIPWPRSSHGRPHTPVQRKAG